MKLPSIVCSDLDGTLLNSRGEVSEENIDTFRKLNQENVTIALASGRGLDSLTNISENSLQIPTHKICLDGSYIVDADGTVIDERIIPLSALEAVVEIANQFKVVISFATAGKSIVVVPGSHFESLDKHHNYIEIGTVADFRKVAKLIEVRALKIGMNIADQDKLKQVYDVLSELPLHVMLADTEFIEATAEGVTKFSALATVAEKYHLSLSDAIAFGDFENDYELVSKVGYGVAMKNATDHIKQSARFVTKTNDENGVAVMIKQLLAQD